MKKLLPLFKYILIAIFVIVFAVFRRFFLDNQQIIMWSLYTLLGIVLLLAIILLVVQGKVNKYIKNEKFESAIRFAKKFKFYPSLSQRIFYYILMNALWKNQYDFVYLNVHELNFSKNIQWKYFVEVIYYSLTDDIIRVENNLQLLKKCKVENRKLKHLDEIINITSYLVNEQDMTEEFYLENVKNSPIVGEDILMNNLLRKCFNLPESTDF